MEKILLKIFVWVLVFGSFLMTIPNDSLAQGIRGIVRTNDGEALPYASVYVRNLGDGVPTNQDGAYEFKLKQGVYDVLVQYLGYKSVLETVIITD